MDLLTLEKFFFWCMVVNSAVYLFTALSLLVLRDFVYGVHLHLFNMDKQAVDSSIQAYLSNFKLFITVFNFAPWIALLIIQ